jgi:hypothetical protein
VETAVDLLDVPRATPTTDDKIGAQRQHVFKRIARLTHALSAIAKIRIIASRANRKRGNLFAVRERKHELIRAIVERHNAAWLGLRRTRADKRYCCNEPTHALTSAGRIPGQGHLGRQVFWLRESPLDGPFPDCSSGIANKLVAYSCGSSRGFSPRSLNRRVAAYSAQARRASEPPFIEKSGSLSVQV